MKIKCINKDIKTVFPKDVYTRMMTGSDDDQLDVTIGKTYTVYGITTIRTYPWYLICTDSFDGVYFNYPMYSFYRQFEIVDGRLSDCWIAKESTDVYNKNEKIIRFGFKEWVTEEYFYSELLEGGEREVGIFLNSKKRMDDEFA